MAEDALTASAMVIGLRVALMAGHGDSDVERASINLEPEAPTIHDHVARRGRDGGAAVTGVGQADAGQVAEGVRNRDGHRAQMTREPGRPQAGRNSGGTAVRSRQALSPRPCPLSTNPCSSRRMQALA